MTNRRNLYRILHVGPDAPTAVIQASYRTLMKRLKMHPDLGGDHAQAALINEAYATLSDPAKRAAYDRALATTKQRRGATSATPHEPPSRPSKPAPEPPPATQPVAAPREAPRAAPETAPPSANDAACLFCGAGFAAIRADDPTSACSSCGSPLSPAPSHQTADASRRTIERGSRHMPVTFYRSGAPDVACSGTTEDFSLNGMRLHTNVSLPVGERVRIDCGFCSAVAVVRSERPDEDQGGWQSGVEFLTLRIKHKRGGLLNTAG
jgi:curved DNA-binding protein CbpA